MKANRDCAVEAGKYKRSEVESYRDSVRSRQKKSANLPKVSKGEEKAIVSSLIKLEFFPRITKPETFLNTSKKGKTNGNPRRRPGSRP